MSDTSVTLTESELERIYGPIGNESAYPELPGVIADIIAERMAWAWDERSNARPQYLGPDDGHYEGCMGWEDCDCASYPNPYRATTSDAVAAGANKGGAR